VGGAVEGLLSVAEFDRDTYSVHGHVGGAEFGVMVVAVGAQDGREPTCHGEGLFGGVGVGVTGVQDASSSALEPTGEIMPRSPAVMMASWRRVAWVKTRRASACSLESSRVRAMRS